MTWGSRQSGALCLTIDILDMARRSNCAIVALFLPPCQPLTGVSATAPVWRLPFRGEIMPGRRSALAQTPDWRWRNRSSPVPTPFACLLHLGAWRRQWVGAEDYGGWVAGGVANSMTQAWHLLLSLWSGVVGVSGERKAAAAGHSRNKRLLARGEGGLASLPVRSSPPSHLLWP